MNPISLIYEYIRSLFNFLTGYGPTLADSIVEYVKEFVTVTLPNAIWFILPEDVANFITDIDLQPLLDLAHGITWLFPIWGILGIYATAYSLAGIIRLVRFVIGFIPTVEG